MNTLLKRLSEPSTYAGLALAAVAVGLLPDAAGAEPYIAGIAGFFGFIAILKGDPGNK